MPTEIKSKKELIAFFNGVTLVEKFTKMSTFDLKFGEDDFLMCTECEQLEEPNNFFVIEKITDTSNGKFCCASCKEDLERPERNCSGCGTKLRHFDNPTPCTYFFEGREHGGEVCRTCSERRRYHASYVVCGACNRYESPERMQDAGENVVCQNCINRNYYHCEHCNEYHRHNGNTRTNLPKQNVEAVERRPIGTIIDAEFAGLANVV